MTESDKKPVAPQPVWSNQVPSFSPEITPNPTSPHMAFNCAEATSDLGDTLGLFAGFNLGWPYTELYGGQLPAPINVVAINTQTGAVYFNPAYYSERSLQRSVELFLSPTEVAAGEPEFNRSFVNAWFNMDLPRLLQLPPGDGTYNVCLWLDDLVTPMQTVQVSANSARTEAATTQGQAQGSNIISIRKSSYSPAAEEGVIRTDGPLQEGRNRIYATLPDDVFSTTQTSTGTLGPILSVLGFTQTTRRFFWYSDTGFYDQAQKAKLTTFDFDPFQIIDHPTEPESIFVVTILGSLRSEALWIPSELSM